MKIKVKISIINTKLAYLTWYQEQLPKQVQPVPFRVKIKSLITCNTNKPVEKKNLSRFRFLYLVQLGLIMQFKTFKDCRDFYRVWGSGFIKQLFSVTVLKLISWNPSWLFLGKGKVHAFFTFGKCVDFFVSLEDHCTFHTLYSYSFAAV